ncbi:MAG: hypothetical protein WAN86_04245 [Hyphomicrobiaceae bacterium]
MSNRRPPPSKAPEPAISQVTGARKDQFIRGVLEDVPDLDADLAAQVADHLCGAIDLIKADRSLIERHLGPKPPPKPRAFDPHAFSLMKVYRASGERGLREKLRAIVESSHLQALANAQKISLPIRLRADAADAAGLKEAIVRGVISRYEDWQAAS